MLTLLRSYLNHPHHSNEEEYDEEHTRDIEFGPVPRGSTPPCAIRERWLCHYNLSRPLECPPGCDLYRDFYSHFLIAPSRDGKTVLVYHASFTSEVNGVPVHGDDMAIRCDEPDGLVRMPGIMGIYEHLFAERNSHPRIVQYLGPTVSGYRLESLEPGPLGHMSLEDLPSPRESDVVLALYQRWAIQILSALAFTHSRGIVVNAVLQDSFWLRKDFSIALACFTNAASVQLNIREGGVTHCTDIRSPWSDHSGELDPPYTEKEVGHPKGDIFDWASLVYPCMSDHCHPLEDDAWEVLHAGVWTTEGALARSRKTHWPELEGKLLGPVLVKAWRGEYETADEALVEARTLLIDSGRAFVPDCDDELAGFNWRRELEVVSLTKGEYTYPHLRRREKC